MKSRQRLNCTDLKKVKHTLEITGADLMCLFNGLAFLLEDYDRNPDNNPMCQDCRDEAAKLYKIIMKMLGV